MKSITVEKARRVRGRIAVPGDKSISHRAVMLGSIATGQSTIKGFLSSEDCLNTLKGLRSMGVDISVLNGEDILIFGKGLYGLERPKKPIDCGNSGTSMRLLSGILVGQGFTSKLIGDRSLSSRPMDRIIAPLRKMGCDIRGRNNRYPPLVIKGKRIKGIDYISPIASAQVKSCILFAGLYTDGKTSVTEPYKSRDHSERMLKFLGAELQVKKNRVSVHGGMSLEGKTIVVPGDISSAAYFIALAILAKDAKLHVKGVGLNPTRRGIIDVLRDMGAGIEIKGKRIRNHEPQGDMSIGSSKLKACSVTKRLIPRIIDEIPILALCMTQAEGVSEIRGAEELRVKESDRIRALVSELTKMGAFIKERRDGMIIEGPTPLKGRVVNSYEDHRLAMTLAIAGKIADGKTVINNTMCIKTSFPNFKKILDSIAS